MTAIAQGAHAQAAPFRTPRRFVGLATLITLGAQAGFVALLSRGAHAIPRAEALAPDPRAEIAVAVDAIDDRPLLKYGAAEPTPSAPATPTERARPAPRAAPRAAPTTVTASPTTPTPTLAPAVTPAPTPAPNPNTEPTGASAEPAPAGEASASAATEPAPPSASTPGSPRGSDAGTETDPLKGRVAAGYRAQLDGWFSARFHIRGKLPFEALAKLAATVIVQVSEARRVVGFTIAAPSGDPIFDAQLRGDLAAIQASGVELPAPPPARPELLGSSVSLRFACSVRAACE